MTSDKRVRWFLKSVTHLQGIRTGYGAVRMDGENSTAYMYDPVTKEVSSPVQLPSESYRLFYQALNQCGLGNMPVVWVQRYPAQAAGITYKKLRHVPQYEGSYQRVVSPLVPASLACVL